jgi:MFS family permease
MSVYLPVVVKTLLGDVGDELNYVSAYINALYLVGWAAGGFTWGMISDKIGRSKALMLCMGCYGIFTGLIHFAASWEQVVALRLIAGFGVGGVLVISATYLSEIWPVRSRSIIIGIVSIGFPIGVFSAGLTNYIVSDWRQAFLLGFVPLTISILSIWLLRESDQWKASKITSTSGEVKFTADVKANLLKGAIIFGAMLIGLWAIFSWLPTWVQSLLSGSDGQSERGLTMMLLGAGGLSGGFFSGWISNALGVRRAMMLCFFGCICMSVLLFGLNTTFSEIVYVETAALALFFGISQGLLSIYIPQLFPVNIRATATGICFNVGRLVTAVAVFFVGALVVAFGGYGNTILTFSTVFVIGFITLYFTKDKVSK